MSCQNHLAHAVRDVSWTTGTGRGGGEGRRRKKSLFCLRFTFELISMLQVLQISALDVQSYNPRLYHILYTEQSLKPLILDKERVIKSTYRDWDFPPSVSAVCSHTPWCFISPRPRGGATRNSDVFASAREPDVVETRKRNFASIPFSRGTKFASSLVKHARGHAFSGGSGIKKFQNRIRTRANEPIAVGEKARGGFDERSQDFIFIGEQAIEI